MVSSCNKLNVRKYIFLAIILPWLWPLGLSAKTDPPSTTFQQVDSLLQHKDFATAQTILDKLIDQGRTSGDRWLSGKSYAALANLFLIKGEVDHALKNYLLSLKFLDEGDYPTEVGKIYANMGGLYSRLKQFQEAESYLLKALQLHPTGDNRLKYLTNLFGVYLESGKNKLALHTFEEAIALAKSQKNPGVEAILYTNLSNYYIHESQWNQAISNARKSLQLRADLQQAPSVITLNNLGYALAQLKKYSESIRLYEQALPYASLAEKKQLYYNLYQANKLSGNSKESWRYIEAYDQVKDSLVSLNYAQKVAELDATYQAAEKQRTIKQLATTNMLQRKQLKQQTYLILAGILIVVLALATWYLRRKQLK